MATPFAVHFALLIGFMVLLLTAAAVDTRDYLIPNRLSVAIALLYPAHLLTSPIPIDWLFSIGVAAATLTVGFALFAARLLGGGDAKLMAACALWAGGEFIVPFLLMTTLSGGALAFAMWLKSRFNVAAADGPELDTGKPIEARPIPYGVAIAIGGVHVALSKLVGV